VEEVIAFLIQLLLEVGLQLFGSIGIDLATTSKRDEKEEAGCGWLTLFVVTGGICGALSLLVAPRAILPTPGLRIANLIVAPLLAGALSYLVARYVWTPRGWPLSQHFWRGFWFALPFGLVRFAYLVR
jgi:hypothetical protein